METRYRLIRRGVRGGTFYCVDTKTGKRNSLRTGNEDEAQQIINAKNQALRQPVLNMQIAKAYLYGTDNGVATRTWQQALDALTTSKEGDNRERWKRGGKEKPFDLIRDQIIIETSGETLLQVMRKGTVSTNIYLRRLHNFCLDMDWLLKPIIPKRQWPKIKFKERRGITFEEHQKILACEHNPELHDYYEMLWHLGGSQTDVASLRAEDIDWTYQTISYARQKTGSQALIRFGDEVAKILRSRPATGYLFPQIVRWKESDRGKAFIRRLRLAGVSGVSLHCYRYAWAERAKTVGYPERFAQEALGHKSAAVHRAYARKAQVLLPPLEEYEKRAKSGNLLTVVQPEPAVSVGQRRVHSVPCARFSPASAGQWRPKRETAS
jgi:integrase